MTISRIGGTATAGHRLGPFGESGALLFRCNYLKQPLEEGSLIANRADLLSEFDHPLRVRPHPEGLGKERHKDEHNCLVRLYALGRSRQL